MIEKICNALGENLESRNLPMYLLEWVGGTHFVTVISCIRFPCTGSDSSFISKFHMVIDMLSHRACGTTNFDIVSK